MGTAIKNYQRRLSLPHEKEKSHLHHQNSTSKNEEVDGGTSSTITPPTTITPGRRTSIYLDHTEDGRPVLIPESKRISIQQDYKEDKEYLKYLQKHSKKAKEEEDEDSEDD